MNRRFFLQLGLPLIFLAACSKKPKFTALPAGSQVLAFGDSVTYGTGAQPGEDWPTKLALLTGWQLINAGLPGDTAEAARSRIQALLDEHKPALVILEIGGNDFLRRRPARIIKEDIRALVRSCQDSGSKVVLVGVPELSLLAVVAGKPSDSPLYAELGAEEGVPVIADVFSNVLAKPELCADKIHPNAQGYQQMAQGIAQKLRHVGLAN